MNAIPDLIWLKSVDGKYLFVNHRFEDFFGAKEHDIIGKTDYDFVDNDLADFFRKHDKKAMRNGVPTINEEYIVFANDNHGELLETTKVPVLSKEKDIIGVLGIGKDITAKREAEKALKASNAKYLKLNQELQKSNEKLIKAKDSIEKSEVNLRTLINTIPDLIWLKSVDGKFLFVNNRFEKLFDAKESDIIGKTDYDFLDKELADFFTKNDRKAISNGFATVNEETATFANDNHSELLETTKVPVYSKDKDIIGVLGIGRDITAKRKAEKEIEQKTIKLNALNKSLNLAQKLGNIASWQWNIESDKKEWSDQMYRIYGVTKDNFCPSSKSISELILQEDLKKVEQSFSSLLNGKPFVPLEFRIKRPSGEIRDLLSVSVEKQGENSFFGVTKDITEQKQVERDKLKSVLKLQKTENDLNEAQKLAQIGSWLINPINKNMKWSEETFHIWGFNHNEKTPKYDMVLDLIHKDDLELFKNSVEEASLIGIPFDIEFRICIPSFPQKTIRSICKPVFDASNNIVNLKGTNQDITEQVKQQQKILNFGAESRAMKSAVDFGWLSAEFSIDGTILKVNDNFISEFGYSSGKDFIGKHHKMLCDPFCEGSKHYKQFWENLANGKEQKGEFKRMKKDGSTLWINGNYTPVKDINGNYYKVIKIANDISEMVKNRLKITAIANELQQFIETANAPIFGIDNQGLVNEWNQTSEKITGFKKEEVFGKNLVETYITKNYQKSVRRVLYNALQGKETANYEFPLFAKNGTRVMVLLNSSTRRDINGKIIGVLGVGQDITQIDNLRTVSVSIAKELRQFIETANAPIFGIDSHGLVNEWNQTSEKITGFKKKEVLGKNLVETYITKDYQTSVKQVLDDALQGKETANYEFPLFAKNGTRVMVLLNSTTRRDTKGQITGVLGVGQDITELDSYRKELEIKVNERTLKLNESLEKQKELNELKSRFVSTTSHEFRTPLSAINFAAGSIKKYWSKMEPIMISNKLNKIEDQVLHMTKLLDDILIVGQADVGKLVSEPSNINLGDFIYEIIEEVNISRKKSHEIILTDKEELIHSSIYIDEKLGRNIFINLIDNALKFSPEAKKVTVDLASEEKYIIFIITDFGIGIPEFELKNIYSPFTRGKNVDLIQGTGLGLSIVKEAVDLTGGKIEVSSKEGKGTTFIVKIPKGQNVKIPQQLNNKIHEYSSSENNT